MASYSAHARSNYFGVTDPVLFAAFCRRWSLNAITSIVNGETLHGFTCDEGLPHELPEQDDNDGSNAPDRTADTASDTADFDEELAALLADGAVAVLQEIGYERMRYLAGFARAINSRGDVVRINLDTIYELAASLGTQVTLCEG